MAQGYDNPEKTAKQIFKNRKFFRIAKP